MANPSGMSINRRQFLTMTAAAVMVTDCLAPASDGQVVDAGPVGNYAADGVYDAYRSLGFFVVRKGDKISAISSYCTHKRVTLTARHDCSFYCKRHGSTFDPGGHVTKGPAKLDLPVLATSVNGAGHLLVTVSA